MKRVKLMSGHIGETVRTHWLLIHAVVAPWGTLVTTGVLVNLDKSVPEIWEFWGYWNDVDVMSGVVSYGAVVYGSAISVAEVTARMVFYAIAKMLEEQDRRRKRREKMLNEAREQGLMEGREEGRKEGRETGIDLVLSNPNLQQYPDLHERIIKDLESAMEESRWKDLPRDE